VQCIEFKHETKLTSGDSDSAEISISDTDHLVCVCVCVRERERERDRDRERERERERKTDIQTLKGQESLEKVLFNGQANSYSHCVF